MLLEGDQVKCTIDYGFSDKSFTKTDLPFDKNEILTISETMMEDEIQYVKVEDYDTLWLEADMFKKEIDLKVDGDNR